MGRLQILTGIATLAAASIILTISGNGVNGQNRKMPLQVFPMLFITIGFLLFTSGPRKKR